MVITVDKSQEIFLLVFRCTHSESIAFISLCLSLYLHFLLFFLFFPHCLSNCLCLPVSSSPRNRIQKSSDDHASGSIRHHLLGAFIPSVLSFVYFLISLQLLWVLFPPLSVSVCSVCSVTEPSKPLFCLTSVAAVTSSVLFYHVCLTNPKCGTITHSSRHSEVLNFFFFSIYSYSVLHEHKMVCQVWTVLVISHKWFLNFRGHIWNVYCSSRI